MNSDFDIFIADCTDLLIVFIFLVANCSVKVGQGTCTVYTSRFTEVSDG